MMDLKKNYTKLEKGVHIPEYENPYWHLLQTDYYKTGFLVFVFLVKCSVIGSFMKSRFE